jgi:hypothetical protein
MPSSAPTCSLGDDRGLAYWPAILPTITVSRPACAVTVRAIDVSSRHREFSPMPDSEPNVSAQSPPWIRNPCPSATRAMLSSSAAHSVAGTRPGISRIRRTTARTAV